MHDTFLASLEIYVLTLLFGELDSKKIVLSGFLLGFILANKPSHIIAVVIIGLVAVYILRRKCFYLIISFTTTSAIFLLPSLFKSISVTKSAFFPYFNSDFSRTLLSPNIEIFNSYPAWEIHNLKQLLVHLFFPGGSPRINNELAFVDPSISFGLLIVICRIFYLVFNNNKKILTEYEKTGISLISIGVLISITNQLIFTGVRYSMVSYSICTLGIVLVLINKTSYLRKTYTTISIFLIFIVLTGTTNPKVANYSGQSYNKIPDYGRISSSLNSKIFSPKFDINLPKNSTILLGQEQISFVAAMFDDSSYKYIGLQAYILGEESRIKVADELISDSKNSRNIYVVFLEYNRGAISQQLSSIVRNYSINNCRSVSNPFNRDISLCSVILN
jgi:hypothetical protein